MQLDSIDTARCEQEDANSIGILYPGQRMDFILHSSPKDTKQSSIMISLDEEYDCPPLHNTKTSP